MDRENKNGINVFFRTEGYGAGNVCQLSTGTHINESHDRVSPEVPTHTGAHTLDATSLSATASAVPSSPSRRNQYSCFLLLNIWSMNPSALSPARYKVEELKAHIAMEQSKDHIILFIAIIENWLKSYMKDAQISIPNYVVSRCDRGRHPGGCTTIFS